jgi:hypothetical protein
MFCERHCDDVVLRTVDKLAATGRVTTESIEGERVKGQHKLIKTRHFLISDKSNRDIPKCRGARDRGHSPQSVRLCAKV